MRFSAPSIVNKLRYTAFGETRYENGVTPTDYRYTGQREEAELGLYYYVARWYDPALGRFTQADTIVPNPGSAKAYDRYAYVMNNPLKYVDPSGHQGDTPCTISGNCVEEWENEDGDGGGEPGNIDEDVIIVICGSGGGGKTAGLYCDAEINKSINTYPDAYYNVWYPGGDDAKNDQYELALAVDIPKGARVIIVGYSGGADTAIAYAKFLIGQGVTVSSLVLLGPTFSGNVIVGEKTYNIENDWETMFDEILETGTDILVFDDSGAGGSAPQNYESSGFCNILSVKVVWHPPETGAVNPSQNSNKLCPSPNPH